MDTCSSPATSGGRRELRLGLGSAAARRLAGGGLATPRRSDREPQHARDPGVHGGPRGARRAIARERAEAPCGMARDRDRALHDGARDAWSRDLRGSRRRDLRARSRDARTARGARLLGGLGRGAGVRRRAPARLRARPPRSAVERHAVRRRSFEPLCRRAHGRSGGLRVVTPGRDRPRVLREGLACTRRRRALHPQFCGRSGDT